MCSILLPQGAIDLIDKKRRAFLWAGEQSCSGSQCKAPWDLVCLPKHKGGLGFKDLSLQNSCLLRKFLFRLHESPTLPWQLWFSSKYGWSANVHLSDTRRSDNAVWRGTLSSLAQFRSFTSVTLGNGQRTAFWLDTWLGDQALAALFPALFFHALNPNIPVSSILSNGNVRSHLHPRLTLAAEAELLGLLNFLDGVAIDPQLEDVRHIQGLPSSSPSSAISYQRSFDHLPDYPFANCIWPNDAPPKCLFFPWETHHQKLNTNCRLNRRGSDNDGPCPF